jgi:methylenetetrahydrofolate reductase (NADPH)
MILAPVQAAMADRNPVQEIARFMRRASFEATRLTPADIEALKADLPAGARIYVASIPTQPLDVQLDVVLRLKAHGFEPVPHVAARNFASAAVLDEALARFADAGVRTVLVIGGDRAEPAGTFHSALEVIDSGLMQNRGITEIGISGYPEGHPRIPPVELDRHRAAKIEVAQQTGLRVHIVTQFAFSAEPIIAWLSRLRDLGIDHPVRIGLAGPTSLTTLMRYAAICGVKASVQGLARNAGLVKNLFGNTAPDGVVRPLADIGDRFGDIAPHIYSFGGLGAAVRWTAAVAAGRIRLDGANGFTVEAP